MQYRNEGSGRLFAILFSAIQFPVLEAKGPDSTVNTSRYPICTAPIFVLTGEGSSSMISNWKVPFCVPSELLLL
jgi:hypothetical protein